MASNTKLGLLADLRHSWLICSILCIGMLPMWVNGYCMYVLILLLPVVLFNYQRLDPPCCLLILFSIVYVMARLFNGAQYAPSGLIFDIFYPFISYQVAGLLVRRFAFKQSSIVLIALMIICLGLPAIVANVRDAASGELINMYRLVTSETGDVTRSATGFGMMLAPLIGCFGLILIRTSTQLDSKIKILLFAGSVLALFSTIHLLNRTGLVLGLVSVVLALALPPSSMKKMLYCVTICVVIVCALAFVLGNSTFIDDAIRLYEARDQGTGSAGSYGGRDAMWAGGLAQIFSIPQGTEQGIISIQKNYAHNMWIDAGIKGGLLCFIMLICFTIIYVVNLYRFFITPHFTRFERNFLLILGMIMLLQMGVEPVIDGVPQLFWIFVFIASVIIHLNRKRGSHLSIDTNL